MKYKRPPPATVNYPGKDETINKKIIDETLYVDPTEAKLPHVPGKFKGTIGF